MAKQGRLAPALLALVLGAGLAVSAGQTLAQVSLDQPLDERGAKRIDRMEKAMKELRAIVFQGRETGAPVVVQPAETQGQIAGLSDKIADLSQSLARANGQLEVLKHDLDQSRGDAADLRSKDAALRERLALLEKAVKDLTPPPPPPTAAAGVPQDPAGAFAAAKAVFDAGDMAGAEAGFHDYIDRYGDGPGGPEARYFLAKTLIARRAWPDAATAAIGAIRGWPRTRWAPDAVLDLSRSLIAIGKPADACQTLDELARRYPKAGPTVAKTAGSLRAKAQCG